MRGVYVLRLKTREGLRRAKPSYKLRQIHFVGSGIILSQSAVGRAPNAAEPFYILELGTVLIRSLVSSDACSLAVTFDRLCLSPYTKHT